MTIVHCPRCRDEVTVPAKATGRALVRCPLCLEEYLLAEALSNAPPPLVIIGGEVSQAEIAPAAEDAEYQLSAASFPVTAAPTRLPASPAARPLPRSVIRTRKREKNGLTLLVAYVGGGVLGLALGMLVLWWVIGRDPLNAGPAVAAYVPWIVPAEFRGLPASMGNEHAAPSISILRPAPSEQPKKRRQRREAQNNKPQDRNSDQSTDPLQTLPSLDEPALKSMPTPTLDGPTLQPVEPPVSENRPAGLSPQRETVEKATHAADSSANAPPPPPNLLGLLPDDWQVAVNESPRRRSLVSISELQEAVTAAANSLRQYGELPASAGDARAESLADFWGTAGEVGRLLSYRDLDDAELAEQLNAYGAVLGEASKKSALVTGCELLTADRWPEMPDGYGVLAAGTLKAVSSSGTVYMLTIAASGQEKSIELPIATPSNPQDLCEIGDLILAAGRIVEDPQVNLPGYDGKLKKLLSAGYLLPIAKPK